MVVREGIVGLVAGIIVWVVVNRTENIVLAMATEVVIVALFG